VSAINREDIKEYENTKETLFFVAEAAGSGKSLKLLVKHV
jgi:hypothetical protein